MRERCRWLLVVLWVLRPNHAGRGGGGGGGGKSLKCSKRQAPEHFTGALGLNSVCCERSLETRAHRGGANCCSESSFGAPRPSIYGLKRHGSHGNRNPRRAGRLGGEQRPFLAPALCGHICGCRVRHRHGAEAVSAPKCPAAGLFNSPPPPPPPPQVFWSISDDEWLVVGPLATMEEARLVYITMWREQ